MVYVCERCGDVTDDPNVDTDYEYYGGRCYTESWLGECHCGGELAEAKECPECGKYHAGEYDVCDECLDKHKTLDSAKKFSDTYDDADVRVPDYLNEILGKDVIRDLAYEELHNNPQRYENKIKAYFDANKEDFAEWLKERLR